MNREIYKPPAHLSERSQSIWAALVPQNARTVGRRTLLQTALESLDTADKARAELGDASLLTKTLGSGTVHANPLLKIEKEARAQFATIWSSMGLSHYGEDNQNFEYWLKQQGAREG